MFRERLKDRKGLVTAVIVGLIAFGCGHLMQTVLVEPTVESSATPVVPVAPEEAQIPVVLKTPPKPRIPATFG